MKKKAVEYSITAKKQNFEIIKIKSSTDSYEFARKFYHEDILIYESSFIILLNRAGNVSGYAKISQGGVCGTIVDTRIIAKYAIDSLAESVIFIHNHPSGNTLPSREDISMSKKIKEALHLFSINLLDSIVLSEDGYYSMADEGVL